MDIEFDSAKDAENIGKHDSLSLAVNLDWGHAMTWPDNLFDYGKIRMNAIAPLENRLYFVALTERGETMRPISLRHTANAEKNAMSASFETIKTRDGREFLVDTPQDDARIAAAAASDPDARPMTGAQWEAARTTVRIGRPPYPAPRKAPVTLRLDVDILESLKATGKGWQTRVNEIMRDWLNAQSSR